MDTSNNQRDLQVKSIYNLKFGIPEEQELAEKSDQVIKEIVNTLKPILRYVQKPLLFASADCRYTTYTIMGVEMGTNPDMPDDKSILILQANGTFFSARKCKEPQDHFHFHYGGGKGDDSHKFWPIEFIIESLGKILAEAKAKREKHLASIAEHNAKLDQILEILKS